MIHKKTKNDCDTPGSDGTFRQLHSYLLGSVSACLFAGSAFAAPLGGNVVGGSANISGQGSAHVVVNQASQHVVIDWQSLDIAKGESLQFNQPNKNAWALNRVTNGVPTKILGDLRANGGVVVMNPNGVVIGKTGKVNVGSLIVSASDVDTDEFMNSDTPHFNKPGNPNAKIVNQGTITAAEAGLVGFVAPQVENEGLIEAHIGKVQLQSGSTFTLDLAGDELVQIAIDDAVATQLVKNSGSVKGDRIIMTAAEARNAVDNMVVNTGVLEASSVSQRGGKIILGGEGVQVIAEGRIRANGTQGGSVKIAGKSVSTGGTIEAKGTTARGGDVVITAEHALESTSATVIDVSGATGGSIIQNAAGSVSSGSYFARGTTGVGGSIDWGGNISLMSATLDVSGINGGAVHLGGLWQNPTSAGWDKDGVHLDAGQNIVASSATKILANASGKNGNGGEIVLRAQDKSYFGGAINTRGGSVSGLGGRAEVSGATINLINGYSITSGYAARPGEVLLDPQNITIGASNNIDAVQMLKLAHQYALVNSDYFGTSVALNSAGNILAVGAYGDDTGGSARGAVYLFGLDPGQANYSPVFGQKIANGVAGLTLVNSDYFGVSLDLNAAGNILAVGAQMDDTGGTDRGAVYLFSINTGNLAATPTMQKKLANGVDGITLVNSDYFGSAVALNDAGNVLAVGAYGDDTGGTARGAVHLITLNPGALSGASTYGYKLRSGSPGLTLVNSDNFGYSVALNGTGDILAVGATGDDTGGTSRGAAYLFNVNPASLATAPTFKKKIANGVSGLALVNSDVFGSAVSLNSVGDILAVGAYGDDTGGLNRGAVYLFNTTPSNLTANPTLQNIIRNGTYGLTLTDSDTFGRSVSLNGLGDMMAVGAQGDDTGGLDRGTAYLFDLDEMNLANAPVQRNRLHNSNPDMLRLLNTDRFGISTALNGVGNVMAVGAYLDDTGGTDRGAVYLFSVDETNLSKSPVYRYKINSGNSGLTLVNTDTFGVSVSLNTTGNVLAVGAYQDDTGGSARGAVYLFGIDPNNLAAGATYGQKIANGTSGLTLTNTSYFGISVDLNGAGDILAVGASADDTGGTDRGAVFLWNLDQNNLATTAVLKKKINHGISGITLVNSDGFGREVSLNGAGNILTVGATGDDTGGTARGALYVLGLNPANLTLNPTYGVKLANGVAGLALANSDNFGISADLNDRGDLLAVGAYLDDTGGTDRGAVYLFTLDPNSLTTTPTLAKKLTSGVSGITLANSDGFGTGVALNGVGNILAVGAYADDTVGTDRGAVYMFNVTGLLSDATYSNSPGANVNFTTGMLASLLNSGNNVTLQANNDITVATNLLMNNPSGNAGNLTLQAGRSVVFNANVTTDNGNLIVIANDTLANGVVDAYRLVGAGGITMAGGTVINAGTGSVQFITRDGAGKTYSQSGDTTLNTVTASSVVTETTGDIILNGQLTMSGAGNAIILAAGNNFTNNFGGSVMNLTGGGRFLVYSSDPLANTLNGLSGFGKRYNTTYTGNPPASIGGTASMMLYDIAPVLTIVANNDTREYGDPNPTFGYTVGGFIDGDTSAILTGAPSLTTTANSTSGVGAYSIDAALGGLGNPYNYGFAFTNGTLSVTPATVTITADDATRTYGASNPMFTASYSGFKNSENQSVISGLVLATGATNTTGVGSYAISGSGASAANYNFVYVDGTLDITPAALTIKADDASRTYGAGNPMFTASYTGFQNSDDDTVLSGLILATGATNTTGVGSYAITGSGASAANYTISYQAGVLSITPATVTVTADDATRTYGAANPGFTASYSGFQNSDDDTVISGLVLATGATNTTGVGSYAISGSGATAANYDFVYIDGTLDITPATLTITADDKTRLYGSGNPMFTASYSGLQNSDTGAVVSGLILASGATNTSDVGSYAITASGGSAANYDLVYVDGALDINPATLTVKAHDKNKVMGTLNPTLTFGITGFKNSETASVLTSTPTVSTTAQQTSNPGAYTITASGGTADNYIFAYDNGVMTVMGSQRNDRQLWNISGPQGHMPFSPHSESMYLIEYGGITFEGGISLTQAPSGKVSSPVVAELPDEWILKMATSCMYQVSGFGDASFGVCFTA